MPESMFPQRLTQPFVDLSRRILKDGLTGIYLHGSAAMGCFNPAKSDLDLIVVTERSPDMPVRRAYLDGIAQLHTLMAAGGAARSGLEMSVVLREACSPFVYPTPFEMHFSAMHLSRCRLDPEAYIREMTGTDRDLAAHFTVIRQRGVCLWGRRIDEVFAEVPREDYLDSILADVASARDQISESPVYYILNLARVLACVRDGLVLSKKEGGEWGLKNLPDRYRSLLLSALEDYSGACSLSFDPDLAAEYAHEMLSRIRTEDRL